MPPKPAFFSDGTGKPDTGRSLGRLAYLTSVPGPKPITTKLRELLVGTCNKKKSENPASHGPNRTIAPLPSGLMNGVRKSIDGQQFYTIRSSRKHQQALSSPSEYQPSFKAPQSRALCTRRPQGFPPPHAAKRNPASYSVRANERAPAPSKSSRGGRKQRFRRQTSPAWGIFSRFQAPWVTKGRARIWVHPLQKGEKRQSSSGSPVISHSQHRRTKYARALHPRKKK